MKLSNDLVLNNIEDFILAQGIDIVGFSNINDYSLYYKRIKNKGVLYYGEDKTLEYINLTNKIDNPKLIISVGVSYHQKEKVTLNKNEVTYSKISYGIDYHTYLYEKINYLIEYLKTLKGDLQYYVNVDNRLLDDRFFAYQCGLGFYGKNGMLINPKLGSEVVYGTIVCDLDLVVNNKIIPDGCLTCNICQKACPTNSLKKDYVLHFPTCLSYLSQSKELYQADKHSMSIYGCDICNNCCPYNKDVKETSVFIDNYPKINVFKLLNFSKQEYYEYFSNKSLTWLNYNIIKKNAILLLDYEENKEFIDLYKTDSKLVIKALNYMKGCD